MKMRFHEAGNRHGPASRFFHRPPPGSEESAGGPDRPRRGPRGGRLHSSHDKSRPDIGFLICEPFPESGANMSIPLTDPEAHAQENGACVLDPKFSGQERSIVGSINPSIPKY